MYLLLQGQDLDKKPWPRVWGKVIRKDFGSDPSKMLEDIGKNVRAMPQIKIDDELVGGYNQLVEYFEKQGKVNFKGEIVSEWW